MARKSAKTDDSDVIVIKKYANRRLYNTDSSKYITLDFLADLTKRDVQFVVVDAKSGEDITHNVLTQIIVEEEASGTQMLPVGFLRELISLYGDSMQAVVPQFLEASMAAFRKNQNQFQTALTGAMTGGPLGELTRRNLEFMKAAQQAMINPNAAAAEADEEPAPDQDSPDQDGEDLEALQRQMAELQQKMDRLNADKN